MKPALHTVSYAGVWPGQAQLTLKETVKRAKKLGFAGVEIVAKRPHLSVLDYNDEELQRLGEYMQEVGIECAATAGYTNFSAAADHPDIPLDEMQIAYITELARITQQLGGEIIRVFTAYRHEKLSQGETYDRCVKALRECAQRAGDFGCTIAVQNHHGLAAHYESMYDLIMDIDEPNCRAAFDAWSATLHGDDITEAARKMAPITCYTTCADYQWRPRFQYQPDLVNYTPLPARVQMVQMGEGMIDYEGFLNALQAGGYDGWVAFEMCAPLLGGGTLDNLDNHARGFIEYIKPRLSRQPRQRTES